MATTNFLPWDQPQTNMETDPGYASDVQRSNGGAVGAALPSPTFNKFALQSSGMAYALAEFLVSKGYTVQDSNLANIVSALQTLFAQVPGRQPLLSLTYAPSLVCDASVANGWQIPLAGNTTISVTNRSVGQELTFQFIQQGSGGFTVTWPSDFYGGGIQPIPTSGYASVITFKLGSDLTGRLATPSMSTNGHLASGGGIFFEGSLPAYPAQGGYLGWNQAGGGGGGETDFVNNHGGGPGGFRWYNGNQAGLGTLFMVLDAVGNLGVNGQINTNPGNPIVSGGDLYAGYPANNGTVHAGLASLMSLIVSGLSSLNGGATVPTLASTDNSTNVVNTAWAKSGFVFSAVSSGGYIKFPAWLGGFLVQWGRASSGGSSVVVNFPLAFNNLFVVLPISAPAIRDSVYVSAFTASNFTCGTGGSTISIHWLAVGN